MDKDITDEELRALTQLTDHFPNERVEGWRVKALIAALHASRSGVGKLKSQIADCSGSCGKG